MRALATVSLAGVLLLCATGCGKEEVTADTAPFQAAITSYLAQKSMGMKVTKFQSLKVEDGAATAVCRLEEASGLYAMGVRWRFTFRQGPRGWKVTEHEAL